MSSPSSKDRSPLSTSESPTTVHVSSPLDLTSSPLVVSPSMTSSPKASSPVASPPRSRRASISTARDHGLSASASHPLPAQAPLSTSPIYSTLSLPGHLGDSGGSSFRSRSRSPLGQIDDTITQWRNDDTKRGSGNKTLHGWWTTNEHKGKNLELQEPVPGWQQIKTVSKDVVLFLKCEFLLILLTISALSVLRRRC